jgi:hypothetical protein
MKETEPRISKDLHPKASLKRGPLGKISPKAISGKVLDSAINICHTMTLKRRSQQQLTGKKLDIK